jgi:hypothetical protein
MNNSRTGVALIPISLGISSFLALALTLTPHADAQMRQASEFPQLSRLPLSFEANVGQTDSQVQYVARGGGQTLFLTQDHAVLGLVSAESQAGPLKTAASLASRALHTANVRMGFANSVKPSSIEALDPLPGKVNYFFGSDPQKWHTDIPTYGRIAYRNVYPGVDLVYYGQQGALEYDFVAKPGANVGAIQVQFEGASQIQLSGEGDLLLETPAGEVRWKKPSVYQEENGVRRPVAAAYRLIKGKHAGFEAAGFELAKYNRKLPLVIDPVLVYSTFLGGNDFDSSQGVYVDGSGIYTTGTTYSLNFPTTILSFQGGTYDCYFTKLNPQGNKIIYSTYFGGDGNDGVNYFKLAPDGSIYITGFTQSDNFFTYNAYQSYNAGGNEDAFLTHLSAAGSSVLFSTYLGGSGDDDAYGLDVDLAGNVYVTGETGSSFDFPISANAYQPSYGGGTNDDFLAKFDPTGEHLLYSTYLGGAGDEEIQNQALGTNPPNLFFVWGCQVRVDLNGNAYIAGFTDSSNFPTTPGAYSRTAGGGGGDGFLAELNTTVTVAGTGLLYSTYLGGSGFDAIVSLQIDPSGNALVAGVTGSTNMPVTAGAYKSTLGGAEDGFVARLSPKGSPQLTYLTYIGGSDVETYVVAFEAGNGTVIVSGLTYSSNFPTTPGAYQTAYAGGGDTFISIFDPSITNLIDSTYLGTSALDFGIGVFASTPTDVFVSGRTGGSNFPTTAGAYQTTYGGGTFDAFYSRFTYSGGCQETLNQSSVSVGASGGSQTVGITAPSNCPWFAYSQSSAIGITSAASGSGPGSVTFTVQANTGVARLLTLQIAGLTFTVEQAGSSGCTYTLSPTNASISLTGGSGSFTVTPSASGCSWSVANGLPWLTITSSSGTNGSGTGTVNYSVASSAAARIGTIAIAGGTSLAPPTVEFTVTQPPAHPAFFNGEVFLGSGVYYLQFPGNNNLFGYYNYQVFPVLYHYDLGFEYFLDANDGKGSAYLYDFASGHWFFTGPSYAFPYLYDFNLNAVLYYYPAPNNPGHYSSGPRYFFNFATGKIITL